MTTRHTTLTQTAPESAFPDFPPRDDMNNPLYLHAPAHQASLARHGGFPKPTLVLSEVSLSWKPSGDLRVVLIPDLLIAFNVRLEDIIRQNGYSIDIIGKPPDFVLEVASPSTGVRDYTYKRMWYAEFGIPEYWRFDPSGGEYHDRPLAGDRLGVGGYDAIEIKTVSEEAFRGHSDVLGLDICWEYGQLRFYDPVEGRYLPTFDEEADGRLDAEELAASSVVARLAAEDRAAREAAIRRATEEENLRLREMLARDQTEREER